MALALLVVAAGGLRLVAQLNDDGDGAPRDFKQPIHIKFEGEISTLNQQYLFRKLDEAQARDADLLIIEIDSPGGLLQESLDIAHRLRKLNSVRTVAFIPEQAISGGAIMALGCDEIVMDEHAQIGDAGPIYADQLWFYQYADAKTRTFLTGEVRTLAEAKGRPALLAEAMVDKEMVLFRVRDLQTNQEQFMTEAQFEAADDPDRWQKLGVIDESTGGRYLQLSGRRAVELGLANANAGSIDDLVRRYRLDGRPPVLEWGWVDTTVAVLNHWLTTVLLIIVGLVALYAELASPGIGIGGLISGLCFVLFFWSHFMGGTAGWLEILLFLSGIVFLGVEIFVIPGFGFAGITGILLMVASLVLASQTFVIPTTGHDVKTLLYAVAVVVGSGGGFVIAVMVLSRYMHALPLFSRLILKPPSADDVDDDDDALAESDGDDAGGESGKKKPPRAGEFYLPSVGDYGISDSPLRPAGKVRFGEEFVDVITDGSFVEPGRQVRVIRTSGNRIVVREVDAKA